MSWIPSEKCLIQYTQPSFYGVLNIPPAKCHPPKLMSIHDAIHLRCDPPELRSVIQPKFMDVQLLPPPISDSPRTHQWGLNGRFSTTRPNAAAASRNSGIRRTHIRLPQLIRWSQLQASKTGGYLRCSTSTFIPNNCSVRSE
jgi:hypothetical protein